MNETLNDPVNEKPMTGQNGAGKPEASSGEPGKSPRLAPDKVAQGLGWFSIALGVAELLAPRATAQATGVRYGKNLLQAYGVREIATGIGLLTSKDPQPWLWARVAGDALDFATLATDLSSENDRRRNAAWSMLGVMAVTAVDVWAAESARRSAKAAQAPVRDYSDRVGMALSPDEMRGKARDVMHTATDMQMPSALKPYTLH